MGRPSHDLTEKAFGRLIVVRAAAKIRGKSAWCCACACGESHTATARNLLAGNTRSCGCLQREEASAKRSIHRQSHQANAVEYHTWVAMRARCRDSGGVYWPNYGWRGITVCARWDSSYENFIADMGPRPAGTSIDRVNNDGNYEPGNCRWATPKQQANNRRSHAQVKADRARIQEIA